MTAAHLIGEAKAALARRDAGAAWARVEAALAQTTDDMPERIEALYLGAVLQRMRNRHVEALALLAQLTTLAPELGRAWQERGHCLREQGAREAAVDAYKRAVTCNPLQTVSWKMLAAHYAGQDPQRSAEALAKVREVEAQPQALMAALSAYYDRDYAIAEERVRSYLRTAPTDPVAMRLLAELGTRMGEFEDAELILAHCREFNPDFLPARFDYAELLGKRFLFGEGLAEAEALLAIEPDNSQFRMQRANFLLQIGDIAAALADYDQLAQADPGHALVSLTRGHALKTLGDVPAAIEAYRRAYTIRPDFGDAYWSLANLKTYRFGDDEIAAMTVQESIETTAVEDRIHFCFALGKAHEDRGEYAASFRFYQRGNSLKQAQIGYRPEMVSNEVARQIAHCTSALFAAHAGTGCPADDPIFIVGLPRSGSTLLEQILASHSQVEGTMELPDIMAIARRLNGRQRIGEDDIYPANLAQIDSAEFTALGEGYLASTRVHRRGGRPRFIDKMPNNFRHIGLIHLILPNARIIDARRAPMDCGFSLFKQYFAQGQDFSYDLAHIGRYYADYCELMDHWDRVVPGRVLRVQHENVIADLEGEVRRMLDFCGLAFEQGCVEFHRNPRAVRTPSSEQVRRPINRDGTDQWRAYAEWLEPLRKELTHHLLPVQ